MFLSPKILTSERFLIFFTAFLKFNRLTSRFLKCSQISLAFLIRPFLIIRYCVYDLWLFQLFLAFFNSLYQELSGYVSQISLVLHIYPQEVQEHRLFCSFAWKIRFLLLAHVGKKVKNFTGAHMCTQTQLIMNNLSPTNMPIIKNQVQLGALKV